MALSEGSISASLPTNYAYYTSDGIKHGLNANQSYFTLNDKLIRIYSGAMHYFRVPRAYWRDRLKKIRAAGLNTVETYVPWNLHEPESGKYDFGNGGSEYEDFLHLDEFLNIAKEEDLFVILRTGPYICSEYNFGGFPAWLLHEKTMGFRTSEPTYMKYVTRYFNVLLTLLAAFQFTKGGPVIAFQVENEYGNQEDGKKFQPEKLYLEQLRQLFLNNGIVELLVTSDSPLSHGSKGTLPGLFLQTANLGVGVQAQLDKLEELQPGRPLMVMEFWIGLFDFWGTNHTEKSDADTQNYLKQILDRNASVNIYMFHGGTNFAFNSGATFVNTLLDNSGLDVITTSYDYGSPLTENGAYRNKYYIVKKLVAEANPIKTHVPEPPRIIPPVAYNATRIRKVIPFKTLLENNTPLSISSTNLMAMEKLDINNNSGQSNGYIVYRKENISLEENSTLIIEGNNTKEDKIPDPPKASFGSRCDESTQTYVDKFNQESTTEIETTHDKEINAIPLLCDGSTQTGYDYVEGNVCDTVLVLLNGELIAPKQLKRRSDLDGFGFWKIKNSSLTLNNKAVQGATIDLVVEEMGRINVGTIYQYNHTFKGLWQGNVTINNQNVYNWKIVPLELKKQWVNELQGWENHTSAFVGPAMYNTVLHINDEPKDTYIDIRGWGKGMIFVNGFALGRYAAIGPQKTLYLPAPFLVKGDNQINFFEHFYAPEDGFVTYADELILEHVY